MNKKDYIDAMNEIKADEILKQKTIQKITVKKKQPYIIAKRILSSAAIFVLIFSFAYVNRKLPKNDEQNLASVKLQTVGSYNNMKKIYEENSKYEEVYKNNAVLNDALSTETVKSANMTKVDYSTTNVQVEGVDEADIVKNNGSYIFYYRRKNKDIKVIDAKYNKVIDTLEYDDDIIPNSMYLYDDRLVVIANKISRDDNYRSFVKVFNYDISNISNIKMIREVETEGNLVNSRMIGDYVYIISNKEIYGTMIEEEELLKPIYKDSNLGEETKCVEFNEIQCFPESIENIYMIVSSFNVKSDENINVQTYLGSGNNVYASISNLYVAGRECVDVNSFMNLEYTSYVDKTRVYKLKLDNGEVEYVADTTVPGKINDQFSMDEYNGNFRIATTHNSKQTLYKDVNNLYVLNENMELIGQIENIAPEESIHSVRFMGDKVYMVTFEQVDPLFVIDLSIPTEPKILGELKIPGYSEYLHPYDETHIIGFGKDTKTDGEFVKETGFKMALFDVSDLSNPKEMYSVKIGDSGTYSELLYNHKALLFSKEKNIIAFPIIVREKENGSNYYMTTTFKGSIIYGLSLKDGFEERARISCDNRNISIDRIIYIGDKIFTLDENCIKVVDINNMEEVDKINF